LYNGFGFLFRLQAHNNRAHQKLMSTQCVGFLQVLVLIIQCKLDAICLLVTCIDNIANGN